MQDAPEGGEEPGNLRFLRLLVTVLTVTMIAGFLVLIGFLVTQFPGGGGRPVLPDAIALPEGARAIAFTQAPDWYAVVTDADEILIYDRASGALSQRIAVKTGR